MPVTFFAHQAPVLPIARRWPNRMDGISLVVGSMAPDFAYVLNGSRFAVWAHAFPALVLFCVPTTLGVAWLVARVLSPVVWDHLPQAGPFRLRDYRGLTVHRFSWGWAAVSAFVGALSHVGLDEFTHEWGWFAQHVDWYRAVIADDFLGRQWTVFHLVQYIGHVVGTAVCLWLLARYGRQRWMAASAARVRPFPVTVLSACAVGVSAAAGVVLGGSWIVLDPVGFATAIIRVAAVCFLLLVVTCLALQRARTRAVLAR